MSSKSNLVFVGLAAVTFGCSSAKPSSFPKSELIKKGEYTIVEAVPPEKVSSLEALLQQSSPERAYSGKVELKIEESQLPEVLYYIRKDGDWTTLKSMGSSLIINNEGYFLTVHHAFKEYLQQLEAGNVSSFVLLYDPLYGFAATARPLIFSEQDDILLGKVDIGRYPIATIPISKSNEHPLDMVYSVTYRNKDYILSNLYREVMQSGEVDNNLLFHQNHTLPKMTSKLGVAIGIGHEFTVLIKENPDISYFYSRAIGGDSGSPVFDFNSAQTGIVVGKAKTTEANPQDLVVYTEGSSIRGMITAYVGFVKSNK